MLANFSLSNSTTIKPMMVEVNDALIDMHIAIGVSGGVVALLILIIIALACRARYKSQLNIAR